MFNTFKAELINDVHFLGTSDRECVQKAGTLVEVMHLEPWVSEELAQDGDTLESQYVAVIGDVRFFIQPSDFRLR